MEEAGTCATSPPLMSQVAHLFPEPMPVVLKVQLGATPMVTLHTGNSTLQLQPFLEVFAAPPNLALQFLFSLDVVSDGPGGAGLLETSQASVLSSFALFYSHLPPDLAKTFCPRTLARVEPSA